MKLDYVAFFGIVGIIFCLYGLGIMMTADKQIVYKPCIDRYGGEFVDEICEYEESVAKNEVEILLVTTVVCVLLMLLSYIFMFDNTGY